VRGTGNIRRGWRAFAAAITTLTDSDSGTGTETSDVQATVPGSDTSTGTDTGTVSATVPGSDSGAGTDAQSALSATVPGSDSATGTESSTGAITAPGSDSGTGTEASSTAVTLSGSDSGTGTDAQVSIVSPVSDSDTASDTEAGTVSATVPGSESSTGTESSDFGDESAIYGEPTRHVHGSDRAGSMELGFVVDLTPKSVRPPLRVRLPRARINPRITLDAADQARVVEESVLFVGVQTRSDMARGSESAQLVDITPEDPDEMAMVMALLFD
jgi:hypothetical protein